MTPTEVVALARIAEYGKRFKGKRVFLSTVKDGKRLWLGNGWTEDKALARPYHWEMDAVADQVFEVAMRINVVLDVEAA